MLEVLAVINIVVASFMIGQNDEIGQHQNQNDVAEPYVYIQQQDEDRVLDLES